MPRRAWIAVVVTASLLTSGCFTGERPTLGVPPVGGAAGVPTGDPAVDAVLAGLEGVGGSTFTSTYSVVRKLGALEAQAVVTQDGTRRSVTIGTVRYLSESTLQSTCDLTTRQCEEGIQDARTSDVGLASTFFADSAARMLRVSYSRRAGPAEASQREFAGRTAACVAVPVGSGVETYCATTPGGLAYLDTAAHLIVLSTSTDTADEALFSPLG
jgi:hypothetical protein